MPSVQQQNNPSPRLLPPRKQGVFSRVSRFVKNLVKPKRPPAVPQPPPPRPPPPSPPPPVTAGGVGRGGGREPGFFPEPLETRLREDYRDITGTYTDYLDWLDLFDNLQVDFDDDDERKYFWDMFLRAFYLDSHDRDSVPRDEFYRQTGIPRSAIDWSEWRDLMGYSSRK